VTSEASESTPERQREIAAGLASARARIRAAEDASARPPGSVGLVVVTKTFPVSDIVCLADLGVRDVGENRDQEAAPKAAAVAERVVGRELRWHFVGQLQTNKARSVVGYASVVESVDRLRLVSALGRAAEDAGRVVRCLVQVSLDDRPGRGGAEPAEVEQLAAAIAEAPGLTLGGVMAVAPLGGDPDTAFERLAVVAAQVQANHPQATTVSAGMSGDLEAAVRHGATHVRLGSAILGYRPPVG
jgi:pyridoxal phosphate enzyme (YggS family)